MDMGQRPTLSRIFVVMSAPSTVRVKAIVDSIDDGIKDEDGMRPLHKEGYEAGTWVLLDYGDVVAHVFHEDTRKFYDLENLWGDVPKKNYNPPASKRKANDAS